MYRTCIIHASRSRFVRAWQICCIINTCIIHIWASYTHLSEFRIKDHRCMHHTYTQFRTSVASRLATLFSYHYLMQCCVGHTAWAPDGREGRSQAGPKGCQQEVGAQRAPRLLVLQYYSISSHVGFPLTLRNLSWETQRHPGTLLLQPTWDIHNSIGLFQRRIQRNRPAGDVAFDT